MKKFALLTLLAFAFVNLPQLSFAQCPSGESEIEIVIVPDEFPEETSWELRNYTTQTVIASGNDVGTTICVPSSECIEFKVFDSFGDGIYFPGFCRVFVDGIQVFGTTGMEFFELSVVMNCPPGTACTSPLLVIEGQHEAPGPDTWYRFDPPVNGNYTISTCDLGNTCNTKLYVYDACPPDFDDGPLGVIGYNDDYCGSSSQLVMGLEGNHPVIIRVGDAGSSCSGQAIDWEIHYTGPLSGCMDTLACNFNPLAEIPDNSQCIYPEPGVPCEGPDLTPGYETLVNSLYVENHHVAQPCEVDEGCILGTGERQLLMYGVTIWNIGNQPYYPGDPASNPDAHEWAPCHGHYHYLGFAESTLFDENYNQVDFARKTSYAIINTDCLPGADPNGPALAPGCGDTYPAGYECQWVDITEVPPGDYVLVLRVNSPELPDFLGREEQTYDNNAIFVCIQIGQLPNGDKTVTATTGCQPFVDCLGVPLGNAQEDCAGECNGTHKRGDMDNDIAHTNSDVEMYISQIMDETVQPVACNQLTNDDTYTVLDVARLNACVRYNANEHNHFGGNNGNHGHCNFPFHVTNQQESVELGLQNHNYDDRYFDIYVNNSQSYLLGLELQLDGVAVDSVVNLVGNFNPTIAYDAGGHVMMLALDEFPLNKYYNGAILRVYYSELTSTTVCIAEITDAANADTERIGHEIGDCLVVSGAAEVQENVELKLAPNPAATQLNVTIEGGRLGDARIRVTNLAGQTMLQSMRLENKNYLSLDVSDYPDGIYFLSIENEQFVKTERFVVGR